MPTTTEAPLAPRDAYAALRFRDFRLLIGGRFVAQIGEMMVSIGVGWELYERTSDPFALGLVGLVQVVPVMLLSLPGGYVADRYNRKYVTMISQIVLVVCSLALALMSITRGPLPVLYAILAVIGGARAFNNPAESALTPQVIPPQHYFNAMTWSTSIWQFSSILGPALGGLIIAVTGGAAAVYVVNAFAGLVLVIALLFIRSRQTSFVSQDEPPLQALRGGVRFLRSAPIILASITLDMFAVLLGGATFLLPIFARDILLTDATGLGILRTAPSVGALFMALYLARREPFTRAGRTLLVAVAGFGVATIIFGLSTSFWLSLAMLALLGALDNISVVIRHTLLLTYTPDIMRGRVEAVNTVFIGTSNELGGFESGVAAGILGPIGAVVFGGFGTLVVVAAVAWFSPQLRRLGIIGEDIKTEEPEKPVIMGISTQES
jgi:MFS family permease